MQIDQAILIRDKTRLEQLIERFNTLGQAKFYIERSGGDFKRYEQEHKAFYHAWEQVFKQLSLHLNLKTIYREHVPRFLFSDRQVVIALGQDGLVANVAKYTQDCPLIGINSNPNLYDGVLLPFCASDFQPALEQVLRGKFEEKRITMAEARLNDGQRLLAFNDLFVGPATHTSARYRLDHAGKSEFQSSSGVIVSTGAGSTGWLSSLFNMAQSIGAMSHPDLQIPAQTMPWNTEELLFVVREPFSSRSSSIELTTGRISSGTPLQIESHMPHNGVIFSDGIESDFMHFKAGSIARIGLAKEQARLVMRR